ncbi:MAG: orotidine-5'-phosphate decarboxylase [Phycisphaerales bacterium]|nr:orotidine-5'-phosphate decarboxylase [Phycisphaerales bacterium]
MNDATYARGAGTVDRLVERVDALGTPACVGIDPVLERLPRELQGVSPADAIERFSIGIIDAVAGIAPVVKPQAAMFERYASAGWRALERVIEHARRSGLVVILDAKRGDIGSTSEHYAAAVSAIGADWVTLSPYLGASGIEPFIDAGLGVFLLVRTSNPDSDELQEARLEGGESVAERVAQMVARLGERSRGVSGLSSVGAVVGATKAGDAGSRLRARMPDQMFLVPGVGAQGGSIADVRTMVRAHASSAGMLGVVVNASRSVIYPSDLDSSGAGWRDAIARAARSFADELRAGLG